MGSFQWCEQNGMDLFHMFEFAKGSSCTSVINRSTRTPGTIYKIKRRTNSLENAAFIKSYYVQDVQIWVAKGILEVLNDRE